MPHPLQKKAILLTGATGYLGSNLLKRLVNDDSFDIVVLKRFFSNVFRIKDLLFHVKTYDADQVNLEAIFVTKRS